MSYSNFLSFKKREQVNNEMKIPLNKTSTAMVKSDSYFEEGSW
jgi:hypothetical protein